VDLSMQVECKSLARKTVALMDLRAAQGLGAGNRSLLGRTSSLLSRHPAKQQVRDHLNTIVKLGLRTTPVVEEEVPIFQLHKETISSELIMF